MRNAAASLYEVPRNVLRFITGRLPGAPGIHKNVHDFYAALEQGTAVPVTPEEGQRLVNAMAPACEKPTGSATRTAGSVDASSTR
jgi:hypothetical protein